MLIRLPNRFRIEEDISIYCIENIDYVKRELVSHKKAVALSVNISKGDR